MNRESASTSFAKNAYISSSHPSVFLTYSDASLHKCGHSLLSLNPICLAALTHPHTHTHTQINNKMLISDFADVDEMKEVSNYLHNERTFQCSEAVPYQRFLSEVRFFCRAISWCGSGGMLPGWVPRRRLQLSAYTLLRCCCSSHLPNNKIISFFHNQIISSSSSYPSASPARGMSINRISLFFSVPERICMYVWMFQLNQFGPWIV